MTVRPHQQYMALARLMELLAKEATTALEHLIEERTHLGWPTTTIGDGGSRATNTDWRPERDSQALIELNALIDQIADDITTLASLASSALDITRQAKGHRVPRNPIHPDTHTYCNQGLDHGRRQGANEWGNSDCLEIPVKAGLCHACYLREWRWRKAHHLGPREVQPAEQTATATA